MADHGGSLAALSLSSLQCSEFSFFMIDFELAYLSVDQNRTAKEIHAKAWAMWTTLAEEDKLPYEAKAKMQGVTADRSTASLNSQRRSSQGQMSL